jgi:acyl carrier protein
MMTTTTLSRESILSELQRILTEQFELDRQAITPEAHLYQDLDIDSIDAVDLMVELKELTGRKLDPETFKQVRTVGDVVDALYDLLRT